MYVQHLIFSRSRKLTMNRKYISIELADHSSGMLKPFKHQALGDEVLEHALILISPTSTITVGFL